MAYQGDPRGDPSNLMAYDPNYKPVTGAGDKDKDFHNAASLQNLKEDNAVWGSGASTRASQEQQQRMQGYAAENVASIKADADRDVARIRASRGMAKGGPVIKGEYKHAHPTYTKFGQTADSSLLAKGRK